MFIANGLFVINIVLLYTKLLEHFILFGKRILSSKLFSGKFVKLSQNVDLIFTECSEKLVLVFYNAGF